MKNQSIVMILKTLYKKVYQIPKYGKCVYWELDIKGYWVSVRYIPSKGFWGYCSCVAAEYRKPCKHLKMGIDTMKKEMGYNPTP